MFRRPLVLVFAATLVGPVGTIPVAWAHRGPSETLASLPIPPRAAIASPARSAETRHQPAAVGTTLLVVMGLVLAGLLGGGHRWRRAVVVGLAVMLVLVGFEAAVHSVHHLGDPQGAARCLAGASAERASGVNPPSPAVVDLATLALDHPHTATPAVARDSLLAPTPGRAPPA